MDRKDLERNIKQKVKHRRDEKSRINKHSGVRVINPEPSNNPEFFGNSPKPINKKAYLPLVKLRSSSVDPAYAPRSRNRRINHRNLRLARSKKNPYTADALD
jgi:hypothetical protein